MSSETAQLPVTVVIPVKNEAILLPVCLASLGDFRQIVVADSSSTDETAAIALRAGAAVVQFHWDGRYPKKRNWVLQIFAFQTPWVLFLDADEIVTAEFIAELRSTLGNTRHVGFWLRYQNYFLGKAMQHGVGQRKLALFRVGAGQYERIAEEDWSALDMEVHEHPVLQGSVGKIRAPVEHRDFRGLHQYIARHNEYSSWEARRYLKLKSDAAAWQKLTKRQKLKYGNIARWWFAPAYFLAEYVLKLGFLDGWAGLIHAWMKMRYFFDVYLKIVAFDSEEPPHASRD